MVGDSADYKLSYHRLYFACSLVSLSSIYLVSPALLSQRIISTLTLIPSAPSSSERPLLPRRLAAWWRVAPADPLRVDKTEPLSLPAAALVAPAALEGVEQDESRLLQSLGGWGPDAT